jgi:hypothetical protein
MGLTLGIVEDNPRSETSRGIRDKVQAVFQGIKLKGVIRRGSCPACETGLMTI